VTLERRINKNSWKMNQRERAELISRPNYWGIISSEDVMELLYNVSRWRQRPNAGWFLWECTNGSFLSPRSNSASRIGDDYTLAVTQLYSVCGDGLYVRKKTTDFGRNTGLELYGFLERDVDAYTVYIVKSSKDGRYYEFADYSSMYHCRIPNDDIEYRQWYSHDTLDDAIENARSKFHLFARMLFYSTRPIYCPMISRFISFNSETKSCVKRVWSLQNLCLFFVKNYLKIYRPPYTGPHLPERIKKLIVSMRAVIECNERFRNELYSMGNGFMSYEIRNSP
jgi:hypothetical protein